MEDLSKSIKLLEENINYKFKNNFYSKNAITHPSYKKSKFELLEFIGDRVLNLSIAKMIWSQKHESEQECAEELATKVNKHTLLKIARMWNVQDYILYKGENSDNVLADTCEAIIGAVFLDGEWDSAYKLVQNNWPKEAMSFAELDPKSLLQKWTHKTSKEYKYTLVSQHGPPHKPEYTVELQVNTQITIGVSQSIRAAEKNAALEFLKKYTDLIDNKKNRK
ncbi:hypothetical protein FZC35_00240 [Candidatus Cytomitobacter indipagum]|uniref:Uncharacterized protein n=1 Tax=Candidatus Cytomitobacter indipagum TaxID=2601575 RepID=A0A5C0UDJ7_9PROT|nr:putative dsRNA-binding protein [Candidatus Cytomitobacter indipagum]QEK37820.1 hypothetical protein FZC35_00240 [Candidatus Cytomitobacter indipagum]